MSYQPHGKLSKLIQSRGKAESEVKSIPQQIAEALDNGDQRVRVERLVTIPRDAMTRAINRHNQFFALTSKLTDSSSQLKELET